MRKIHLSANCYHVNKVRDENTSITKQVTLFSSTLTGVHSHGRVEREEVEPEGQKLMVFTLPGSTQHVDYSLSMLFFFLSPLAKGPN